MSAFPCATPGAPGSPRASTIRCSPARRGPAASTPSRCRRMTRWRRRRPACEDDVVTVSMPLFSHASTSSARLTPPGEASSRSHATWAAHSTIAGDRPREDAWRSHAARRWRSSRRSQWWSRALVTCTVPRIGHERTRSPESNASLTCAREIPSQRTPIAHGIALTCCPCNASRFSTAPSGERAAVAETRPWATMRPRLARRESAIRTGETRGRPPRASRRNPGPRSESRGPQPGCAPAS